MALEIRIATNHGDVLGPDESTDNAIVRFDGIAGNQLQDSDVIISDTANIDHADASGTLSIGASNASTINIGRSGATVNIVGTTNYQNVTDLQVTDKLITINKDGGAGSASATGIEFEEDAVITGYVKTSADRNSLEIKAPNTNGVLSLTPGATSFTIDNTIAKSSSGASTDNALVRMDSTTGKLIQTSTAILDDSANLSELASVTTAALNITGTDLVIDSDNANTLTLQKDAGQAAVAVITFPAVTGTLATLAGTETLTNKSIDADTNTITNIENADIKVGAAIARSKLANGTPDHVAINDGSGVLTSEAALSPVRGGTGVSNNAAATLTRSGNHALTITTTDTTNVTFPTSGTLISTPHPDALMIDGSEDEIQLLVQGNGTQTANIFVVETSAGSDLLAVNTTAVVPSIPIRGGNGSNTAPTFSFSNDTDTGVYLSSDGNLDLGTAGTSRVNVNSTALTTNIPLRTSGGDATAPSHSFDGDSDTGMFRDAANELGFAVSGSEIGRFTTTTFTSPALFRTGGGDATVASHSFVDDTDTGLYRIGADRLGVTVAGAHVMEVAANKVMIGADALGSAISGNLLVRGGANTIATLVSTITTGTNINLRFADGANSTCGSVTIDADANTAAYATSSDARLKTNAQDFNGRAILDQINMVQYERISNPGRIEYGAMAQELHKALPQAVIVGGNDPNENPWQVDYSKIVAVLCKAVKELNEDLQAYKRGEIQNTSSEPITDKEKKAAEIAKNVTPYTTEALLENMMGKPEKLSKLLTTYQDIQTKYPRA